MTDADIDILSPKNDFVFKQLFGDANHTAPLEAFLQAALGLPPEEFAGLTIGDPNLNREYEDDKHYILDVRITTRSGRDVDVEIQVRPSDELLDRIQCYLARMVAEFEALAGKDKAMTEALMKLLDMSVDQATRRRAEARAKWLWDESARMRQSHEEGLAEGLAEGLEKGRTEGHEEGLEKGRAEERRKIARELLLTHMPVANISRVTGLSELEINDLMPEKN